MPKRKQLQREIEEFAEEGIAATIRKLNLTLSPTKTPLTGDSVLGFNTKKLYLKHYRGLKEYCKLVGDYESLLMLLEDAPQPACPSISDETIRNYIVYKRAKKGTKHLINNTQLHDVLGNEMTCEGGWKHPND